MPIKIIEATKAINHFKTDYTTWRNNLPPNSRNNTYDFKGYIKNLTKTVNENNGTLEDLVCMAEDAISIFKK